MSDIVLISLIGAVPSTLAALVGVFNAAVGVQHRREMRMIRETVGVLEKNTNSLTEKLVGAEKSVSFQEGGDRARADMKLGADSTKKE